MDPLSHQRLGLTMIYRLKSPGFFSNTSVANNPPSDWPIMVLSLLVWYFFSMNGCSSFSIKDMNLSECPVVGYLSRSFCMVVGKVKSLLRSTVAMPTTIDFGIWLIHSKLLNCTRPAI